MPDNVNRHNARTHANVPYDVNAKHRVLEKDNTIVVKHKRKPFIQQLKEILHIDK